MTTTPLGCSQRIWGNFYSHPCHKPVTVTREGKPYCKIHDPEYRKAKDASKCWERVHGRLCGKPAVEQVYGFGRCAQHSQATVAARERLQRAAPDLLAAAKAALPHLQAIAATTEREQLIKAIAKAENP